MTTMNTVSRKWYSFLADLAIRLHVRRPGPEEIADRARRAEFDANVSRFPLRITQFLRDRLRMRWMRIQK